MAQDMYQHVDFASKGYTMTMEEDLVPRVEP